MSFGSPPAQHRHEFTLHQYEVVQGVGEAVEALQGGNCRVAFLLARKLLEKQARLECHATGFHMTRAMRAGLELNRKTVDDLFAKVVAGCTR